LFGFWVHLALEVDSLIFEIGKRGSGGMNLKLVYDQKVGENDSVFKTVLSFLESVKTLEISQGNAVTIHQDGVDESYYIRCCLQGKDASQLVDLDARLIPDSPDSFRANRELLLKHKTYLRMRQDADNGREFNDIIVEYNTSYSPEKPLKVWGGTTSFKCSNECHQ
jgi:hypothetical protein